MNPAAYCTGTGCTYFRQFPGYRDGTCHAENYGPETGINNEDGWRVVAGPDGGCRHICWHPDMKNEQQALF